MRNDGVVVQAWRSGRFEQASTDKDLCLPQHKDLHMRVGPCVRRAKKYAAVDRVFIMTHPALRVSVSAMLALVSENLTCQFQNE
jgi:hypothetical protein